MPSDNQKNIDIQYQFIFEDGTRQTFSICIDPVKLAFVSQKHQPQPPVWTELNFKRCENCPLDENQHRHCPIALNLLELYDCFSAIVSYDSVEVVITTPERNYTKRTTVQRGLSSLLGIYMVTSGCPIMDKLKPMVRFHLPFATIEETVFRSTSIYLLGQYFLMKKGIQADLELTKLKQFYLEIQRVNQGISNRLRNVTQNDAFANAVTSLDTFAKELPYSIEDKLIDLEYLFEAYFK